MTRAYALALGAGTQAFTPGLGSALFGATELTTDLSLGAGWAIKAIRKRRPSASHVWVDHLRRRSSRR